MFGMFDFLIYVFKKWDSFVGGEMLKFRFCRKARGELCIGERKTTRHWRYKPVSIKNHFKIIKIDIWYTIRILIILFCGIYNTISVL